MRSGPVESKKKIFSTQKPEVEVSSQMTDKSWTDSKVVTGILTFADGLGDSTYFWMTDEAFQNGLLTEEVTLWFQGYHLFS